MAIGPRSLKKLEMQAQERERVRGSSWNCLSNNAYQHIVHILIVRTVAILKNTDLTPSADSLHDYNQPVVTHTIDNKYYVTRLGNSNLTNETMRLEPIKCY